ncbi:MAG: BlaI/MecI/CopY family transcriptional regulator [Pseudomonadota bacterium]|nr:BlaI/MecI/CopY family transcriptional regulator [Pseudomonadota bacterium]
MNLEPLGELETTVMEAMWALSPATAREIHDQFNDTRAYTTIMTTLDRLHHKGLLTREKDGLAWRYQPKLGKAAYERAATEHHVGRLLEEHGEVALTAFVDAAARATSLDRLAELVAARREGRR